MNKINRIVENLMKNFKMVKYRSLTLKLLKKKKIITINKINIKILRINTKNQVHWLEIVSQ